MIELRIDAGTLDLFPNTEITIEEHSPAYLGENVDVLQGEFSYPFTLPLTAHNRQLLGYPDRLDNGVALGRRLSAQLYLAGDLHIEGYLYVDEPSRDRVKVYIASNSLINIKDSELSSLTERGYTLGANDSEVLDHMRIVSQAPLSYDYTFFPLYDYSLADDETAGAEYSSIRFMNNWYTPSGEFTKDGPIVPFPRLEVVLEDVMEATQYSFQNNFQTNNQLRRLCLVNNRDRIDEEGDIVYDMLLAEHLSDIKAGKFVRHLSRVFCLAPFLNRRERTITLQPLGVLIQADTRLDWTAYAGREYSYNQGQAALKRLAYPSAAYAESPGDFWKPDQAESPYTTDDPGSLTSSDPLGNYYDYSLGDIRKLGEATTSSGTRFYSLFKARHFGAIDNENGSESNLPELFPVFAGWGDVPGSSDRWMIPMWNTAISREGDDVDIRLAFHWGNASTADDDAYPFGSWNNYEYTRSKLADADYSLGWEGPYGLYEVWWKQWDTMLQSGKLVTRNFLLPPREINRFSFDQKVRVHNKDYFVKRLRYQVTLRSISPVQVEMVTIS